MKNIWRSFRATWGRPKRRGITGNFSTLVIISGIIFIGWVLTGGEYPAIVPTYHGDPIYAVLLDDQPPQQQQYGMTFRQLKLRPLATPTPTPAPQCGNHAIAFLVDVSGSMLLNTGGGTKIQKIRQGMKQFTQGLSDNAAIAIYSFSEPFDGVPGTGDGEANLEEPDIPEPRQRLPMSRYEEYKDEIPGIIDDLEPYPFAATYMRDAFFYTSDWMLDVKADYSGYASHLIFISDGVPEQDIRQEPPDECFAPGRCYSPTQDPTIPTNLANEVRRTGADIYSIAIYTDQDQIILPKLQEILQSVASEPASKYYKESINADTISDVLLSIRRDICGS